MATQQRAGQALRSISTGRHFRRSILALMVGGGLLWASAADARSFGAGIENSDWYLSDSVFSCTLSHEVPGYGRAVFSHKAGEQLTFYLESDLPLMRPGRGLLVVEAPTWRPGEATRRLGHVDVSDSRKTVEVGQREAMAMVEGLLSGMAPTVTRQARHDSDPVRVRLSNINFRTPFEDYRRCVSGLLPVNFEQIQRSRVPFASGSTALSDGDRRMLDNIATYVSADQTVERLLVDGHSDSIGSRIQNRALSEQRAQVVADYLIKAGVPESMIIVRSHADQFPVSGRAADNRRTTIRLEREGDNKEIRRADRGAGAYNG
ncbi:flagellar protein MotY [Marinobacter sp.]|uniref:flagellar protein MotY n=1 Tax=Marinobacter sp. TaxID=50741 RepID=UPI0035681A30